MPLLHIQAFKHLRRKVHANKMKMYMSTTDIDNANNNLIPLQNDEDNDLNDNSIRSILRLPSSHDNPKPNEQQNIEMNVDNGIEVLEKDAIKPDEFHKHISLININKVIKNAHSYIDQIAENANADCKLNNNDLYHYNQQFQSNSNNKNSNHSQPNLSLFKFGIPQNPSKKRKHSAISDSEQIEIMQSTIMDYGFDKIDFTNMVLTDLNPILRGCAALVLKVQHKRIQCLKQFDQYTLISESHTKTESMKGNYNKFSYWDTQKSSQFQIPHPIHSGNCTKLLLELSFQTNIAKLKIVAECVKNAMISYDKDIKYVRAQGLNEFIKFCMLNTDFMNNAKKHDFNLNVANIPYSSQRLMDSYHISKYGQNMINRQMVLFDLCLANQISHLFSKESKLFISPSIHPFYLAFISKKRTQSQIKRRKRILKSANKPKKFKKKPSIRQKHKSNPKSFTTKSYKQKSKNTKPKSKPKSNRSMKFNSKNEPLYNNYNPNFINLLPSFLPIKCRIDAHEIECKQKDGSLE